MTERIWVVQVGGGAQMMVCKSRDAAVRLFQALSEHVTCIKSGNSDYPTFEITITERVTTKTV